MNLEMFSGQFDLPWWALVAVALAMTHVTIVCVTVFLHRHQAHRALDLHPALSHFFRLWLWMSTGMVTKEWAAVHRKHHAKCETPEDPHSPIILGLNRVLWGGVFLYVKEANRPETIERYGQGTPDDWMERNVYSRFVLLGLTLMGVINVVLFGVVPGLLILATQIVWIPFWAAGVINGIGHYWGYRNWSTSDASTNIVPWGILIGGEELHNNHHAHPTSAKLSNKCYEFDIGWLYIRLFQALGLAQVKHLAPTPRLALAKAAVDLDTLKAVIACRYEVLARYAQAMKRIYIEEIAKLRRAAPHDARAMRALGRWLERDDKALPHVELGRLAGTLPLPPALSTMYAMRRELTALWDRSSASGEQLVKQLQDWCQRAEASDIAPLAEFSRRLRCYT